MPTSQEQALNPCLLSSPQVCLSQAKVTAFPGRKPGSDLHVGMERVGLERTLALVLLHWLTWYSSLSWVPVPSSKHLTPSLPHPCSPEADTRVSDKWLQTQGSFEQGKRL